MPEEKRLCLFIRDNRGYRYSIFQKDTVNKNKIRDNIS